MAFQIEEKNIEIRRGEKSFVFKRMVATSELSGDISRDKYIKVYQSVKDDFGNSYFEQISTLKEDSAFFGLIEVLLEEVEDTRRKARS